AAGGSDQVTVIRDGKPIKVATLDKSFELQGGDTVHVERAPQFYIYGEVLRAGTYPVQDNMSVMQALALGGGITPRGSENRIKLRRVGADGKTREMDAKLTDIVRTDDVIFVRESLF
ncbi:MAG TPA: SLBB domain-containing protein, partial [Burkholderiales bacterium]|nr:SLBB domain-containing protein [Burkholderiales bacterium]